MAKSVRATKARLSTPGRRVGTKRRDMRWEAPDGTVWDSKFEYEVFLGYRRAGYQVRKATESDSVAYQRAVRNGVCRKCQSDEVATSHTYTPDLFVVPKADRECGPVDDQREFSLEAKGYLRAERRSLLRALCKARPDMRLRLLAQRDYRITKSLTLTQWARKYLRIPVAVWPGDGTLPEWS